MRELLKEIWSTARRNKLRTSLTGFAVAWGIFMLIFLLGAGNGLINAQLQQQDRRLSKSVRIFPGFTSKAYKGLKEGRLVRLTDRDISITSSQFPDNVEDAGGIITQSGVTVTLGENYMSAQQLKGVTPADGEINKREIVHGRFINDIDMRESRKVLVVSESHVRELSPRHDLLGQTVKVGDMGFKVVGVIRDLQDQQNTDLITAYTTLKRMYGKGDEAGHIQFKIKNIEATAKANEDFEKRYRERINPLHGAAPDDEQALWVWNSFRQSIEMDQGIAIIRIALWVIGILTLLSGIVGVSNIMLITVKERTHEFGIRKAIGARPWQIMRLIITESVITTALFGYIGMLCGIGANEIMDATLGHKVVDTGLFQATMFVDPTVGLDVCFEATMVIIIAGTLAGLIPSMKAARVRPIEALRGD